MSFQSFQLGSWRWLLANNLRIDAHQILLGNFETLAFDLFTRALEVDSKSVKHLLKLRKLLLLDKNAFGLQHLFVQVDQLHVVPFVGLLAAPVNQTCRLHQQEYLRTLCGLQDGLHFVEESRKQRVRD